MLKMSVVALAALAVVGPQTAEKPTEPQGMVQLAHVSQWDHYHQCNPSPCKRLRDRHEKGTGSVTE